MVLLTCVSEIRAMFIIGDFTLIGLMLQVYFSYIKTIIYLYISFIGI